MDERPCSHCIRGKNRVMSSQVKKPPVPDTIEKTVVDHIKANPDFFQRYPGLLTDVELHHDSGEAISLVERQVRQLREEAARYKRQLEELIAVARENQQLNEKLHQLTLTLIDAVNFDEVVNVLEDKLHDDFHAEAVELHLFSAAEAAGETNPDLDGFRTFLDGRSPQCGRLPQQQLEYLFGPQAEDIRSTALIPIVGQGLLGLLAFGSQTEHRFHPGMGTDYLTRLGEVVSKALQVVLEPGF